MLEIYSEVVRDLLNSKADRKTGLMIREDPKNGFYRTIFPFFLFNLIIKKVLIYYYLLIWQ